MSDAPIPKLTFKLPSGEEYTIGGDDHLRLTEEKLIEARKNQERWQTSSPFTADTPAHADYLRSVRDLPNLLERWQIQATATLAQQIAENYARQGMYAEALMFTPTSDTQRSELYQKMAHAIERPDDDECAPECDVAFQANDALLTKDTLAGWQWSQKHSRVMPVVRCASCGELNVKPLPEELAKQMSARAQAREMTKTSTHIQAKAMLTQAGLTPANIFK